MGVGNSVQGKLDIVFDILPAPRPIVSRQGDTSPDLSTDRSNGKGIAMLDLYARVDIAIAFMHRNHPVEEEIGRGHRQNGARLSRFGRRSSLQKERSAIRATLQGQVLL